MQKFKSVEQLINQLKPEKPVYCIRKNSIRSATKYFLNNFPGKILYAVKTNPHPAVIQTVIDSGVDLFDLNNNTLMIFTIDHLIQLIFF